MKSLAQPGLLTRRGVGMRDILAESWAAKVPVKPDRFRAPKKQKLAQLICAMKRHT
jgi:hypothetical protein